MGNAYLLAYNASLFFGWAYVLFLTWRTVLVEKGGSADVWRVAELPLKVSQSAAIMEIVHAAAGVVRSPVGVTAVQVASRLWCLWGIVNLVPGLTTTQSFDLLRLPFLDPVYPGATFSINLVSLLTAWALSEVIRYGFFALKEASGDGGTVPYFATWLRYSGFLLLYPLGVSSELSMAWFALPAIEKQGLWSVRMPNAANWAFDYHAASVLTMLSYLPGLPHLYGYMLKQRKKVLGGGGAAGAGGGRAAAAGGGRKKRA